MSSAVVLKNEDAYEKNRAENKSSSRDGSTLSYVRLEGEDAMKLDAMFGADGCLVEVNPGRALLPPEFAELGDSIKNLQVYPDDTWLISYPRTGSTWANEMVWCIGNDLDFEKAKTLQQLRAPMIELSALLAHEKGEWKKQMGSSVDLVNSLQRPRYVRSHLPWELLPREIEAVKPKIVYVARNPKDVCVSYYYYCMLIHSMKGSFEDFCELFLKGRVPIGPIWSHVLGYWKRRNEANILFLKYEEMKRDLEGAILQTAEFLGKPLTNKEVTALKEHLSFGSMKKNPAVNLEPIMESKHGPGFLESTDLRFIRKGQIGDWKNHMTDEMAARFDAWTKENLQGSGLSFD